MQRLLTMIAVLAAPVSALAAQTGPAEEPIIITGRTGDKLLAVDFQKVARDCRECKRVLALIEKAGQPYQVKKRQFRRDKQSMDESVAIHAQGSERVYGGAQVPADATFLDPAQSTGAIEGRYARFMRQNRESLAKPEQEMRLARNDVSKLVAAYLTQLEPHVVRAAEAERVERGASGVVKLRRRASGRSGVDVTGAIVRRLDAETFTIVLPATVSAD